jgi:DNA-binding IclR family transcriptional regulator
MASSQTLQRGLMILRILTRHGAKGMRIHEIEKKSKLNKTTAMRLTKTLVSENFLVHDARTKTYTLGPESYAVGLAAEPRYGLQRLAEPHLRKLSLETGDCVLFSIIHGVEWVCLSIFDGATPIPPQTLKPGDHYPLGAGSAGLAMLAFMSKDEQEKIIAKNKPKIQSEFPHANVSEIDQELKEFKAQGYSFIPGSLVQGYWALGVPLLDSKGIPLAAISLVTSEDRLQLSRRLILANRMIQISQEIQKVQIT